MKMAKFLKAMLIVGVLSISTCALAACGGGGNSAQGGVAATVNGTEIPEADITEAIQGVRAQSSMEDEEAWAQFLIANSMTPESVRQQMVDSRVNQELLKQGAADLGVSIEASEIDGYVNEMKANYDSDKEWNEALQGAGFTEDEYRQTIENSLLAQKVSEHFEEAAKLDDDAILENASTYMTYYDGAKRSSHILFGVEDAEDEKALAEAKEKAQEVLDQINAGQLDFAEAAKQYSTDEASAAKGGDVGWDVQNSFVTEYTTTLEELGNDQVSGLVQSEYGIHIIKCTDVFTAPKKLKKLSQLPKEFQDEFTDMAKSSKANEDYTKWLDEKRENSEIVTNDMPADVPYNVDLDKYKTDEDSSDASASSEAASSEGSEEAEEAEGDDETTTVVEGDNVEVEVEDGDGSADTESEQSVDVQLEEPESDEAASADSEKKTA